MIYFFHLAKNDSIDTHISKKNIQLISVSYQSLVLRPQFESFFVKFSGQSLYRNFRIFRRQVAWLLLVLQ